MLFFFSCKSIDSETQKFNKYLNERFNTEIDNHSKTYIVVSENACIGCLGFINGWIDNNINQEQYIFILPRQFKDLMPHDFVLIDSTFQFSKLKFHGGNIGKIKTDKGKIKEMKIYDPYEMNALFESDQ